VASPFRPAALALACALIVLVGCGTPPPALRAETLIAAPAAPQALLLPSEVNGCDPLSAEAVPSHEVTIDFGSATDPGYRPRCVSVAVGDAVKFVGEFSEHPLAGGAVLEGLPVPDPQSPLPYVSAGTEATFRANHVGTYPFYCRVHWVAGMSGVVYVR